MNISIKGKNLELNQKLKDYVEERIGQTLDKLLSQEKTPLGAEIELSRLNWHHRKGKVFEAEINLILHGHMLVLRADGFTIEEAIDQLKNEIEREIKKHKGKEMTVDRKKQRLFKRILSLSPLARFRKK
jgi:ribosomal subunit interface protein